MEPRPHPRVEEMGTKNYCFSRRKYVLLCNKNTIHWKICFTFRNICMLLFNIRYIYRAAWIVLPGLCLILFLGGLCGLVIYAHYQFCDPVSSKRVTAVDQVRSTAMSKVSYNQYLCWNNMIHGIMTTVSILIFEMPRTYIMVHATLIVYHCLHMNIWFWNLMWTFNLM